MSDSTSTGHLNYRPPHWKDLETGDEFRKDRYTDHALTFVKNTALHFLQIVYGQREKGMHRYLDDEEQTELKIADQHAFQLEAADKRPAIIAVRGSLAWNHIGFNKGFQEGDRITSQSTYTDLISSGVGFSCISRVGLEAELLASEVFQLFRFFRTTLMKNGFFTISSMSVGPESLVEVPGEPKLSLVSVLMQCQVQDHWILEPKAAAELRKVVVEMLTDINGNCETIAEVTLEGGS